MSFVSSSLTILMTCWAGVRLSNTSDPTARLCHGSHEVLDHLIAYVGLQQGQTDFPHGLPDVVLCQAALPRSFLNVAFSFSVSPSNAMRSFLQSGGFRVNQFRQLSQTGVLILAVVDGLQLGGCILDGLQMARICSKRRIRPVLSSTSCMTPSARTITSRTLAGDAGVRDLSQRQVLIVIESKNSFCRSVRSSP